MKNILFIAGLSLLCFAAFGQDANAILQKSYDKSTSVQNGYYEMTTFSKAIFKKDTTKTTFKCYFKKVPGDTICPTLFHKEVFEKDKYVGNVVCTGEEYIVAVLKDSIATVMSKSLLPKETAEYSQAQQFYSPFAYRKFPPKHLAEISEGEPEYKYIGEERLNGVLCHHIQVNKPSEKQKKLRVEYHYWITKEDFILIQYSFSSIVLLNDTTIALSMYEKVKINKYELNNLPKDKRFTRNVIPAYYKVKDYTRGENPHQPLTDSRLLPVGTTAPDWELFSLSEEKISLNSLRGQLVLIDFFYKSCYPCIQALPVLQALSMKYKDKGLRIIGIDPFDKKESNIIAFLREKGIDYTILLGGKEVAKNYRVPGYPTIYLIDRTGKIIFSQLGYRQNVESKLEDIIRKNL